MHPKINLSVRLPPGPWRWPVGYRRIGVLSRYNKRSRMRNVWKGLTVGAFAGAAIGLILDGLRKAGEASARAAEGVSTRAKSGATHLADLVEEKFDGWDVRKKAGEAMDGFEKVAVKGKDAVKDTIDNWDVDDKIETAKEGVEKAVDKGKKTLSRS